VAIFIRWLHKAQFPRRYPGIPNTHEPPQFLNPQSQYCYKAAAGFFKSTQVGYALICRRKGSLEEFDEDLKDLFNILKKTT